MASKRSPSRGLERWLRRSPALAAGYRLARERFAGLENVVGFGVGPRFSESRGEYDIVEGKTKGLAVKIYVTLKLAKPRRGERIPKYLMVPVGRKRVRVPLDIVEVGRPSLDAGYKHGWPTAGAVHPGRVFAFGKKRASETSKPFRRTDVRLGTTGALFRFDGDSRTYGASAGHVFASACAQDWDRPAGQRALGVKGKAWENASGAQFFPAELWDENRIRDVFAFPVRGEFVPDFPSWPDGFLRELTTPEDEDRAVLAETATGFVWVERGGPRPEPIPVDLQADLDNDFEPEVDCGNAGGLLVPYRQVWQLRFTTSTQTVPGDSGAPVFLWTEQNAHSRLLGFHFMSLGGNSYAIDGRDFFQRAAGALPGQGLAFA